MKTNAFAKGDSDNKPSETVEVSLLFCSAMAKPDMMKCAREVYHHALEEAVEFSANTNVKYIFDMFRFYNIDVRSWAVVQTADNCAMKKKVAKLLRIAHIACKSHLANREAKDMVLIFPDLQQTLDCIHETMSRCKQTLRNAALQSNIVEL